MTTMKTHLDQTMTGAMPDKGAWLEAWGLVLLALGLFLALSCYTFSPYDYGPAGSPVEAVANLGGPFGAVAAGHVLGRFGIVGMVWPVVFGLWGALTAMGFVVAPRARRVLGFIAMAVTLSGFAELLIPSTGLPEPTFGFGGVIGQNLKKYLVGTVGYGGAMIGLALLAIVSLVLTRHLTISKTASLVEDGRYLIRRLARRYAPKIWALLRRKVWHEWILNQPVPPQGAMAPAASSIREGLELVIEPRRGVRRPRSETPAQVADAAGGGDLELAFFYDGPAHGRAEAALFSRSRPASDRAEDFAEIAANLVDQLAEFKILGEIKAVTQGPVVTTFEFKPSPGTKVSKISALGEDLARLLKAQSLRVLAPIPGKDTVGFEVPNAERSVIGFADLIDAKEFSSPRRKLPIAMGVDIFGNPVIEDLAEMPHLLVAGSTGSGKSVFMNTLIGSLIARHTAATLRFVMIDPKMVELGAYNALPHMACPVLTDPATEAKAVLAQLVNEMENRYRSMRALGARNIESFNEIIRSRKKHDFVAFDGPWEPLPFVVLIIDEMADMMMMLGRDAETPIARLAQKARAAGIHMVIATQRPTADVVTGLIKANFPTRVAFRVLSGVDSRTILDQNGAETLLGKGDMLYLASGGAHRLHGAYLSENEVHAMVKACRKKKS